MYLSQSYVVLYVLRLALSQTLSGLKVKEKKRSTKEEQTATLLLDLTRLSVWLHYYYNIYLIETKGKQGRSTQARRAAIHFGPNQQTFSCVLLLIRPISQLMGMPFFPPSALSVIMPPSSDTHAHPYTHTLAPPPMHTIRPLSPTSSSSFTSHYRRLCIGEQRERGVFSPFSP